MHKNNNVTIVIVEKEKPEKKMVVNFYTFLRDELKKRGYAFHEWDSTQDEPSWYVVPKTWKFIPEMIVSLAKKYVAHVDWGNNTIITIDGKYKCLKKMFAEIAEEYKNLGYRSVTKDQTITIIVEG